MLIKLFTNKTVSYSVTAWLTTIKTNHFASCRLTTSKKSDREVDSVKSNRMTWALFLLISLTMSSGCALFDTAKKSTWQLNPFVAKKEGNITAYALQQELMRFADDYSSMIGEIADNLAAKAKTPTDRVRPLSMKVSQADAAITIASSPNPLAGIMDMTVLVSLTRSSFEDYLVPEVYGADAKGVVEKYKKAETQIWKLAAQVMNAKQLDELKQSIEQWRMDNPEHYDVSFVRLQDLHKSKVAKNDDSQNYGSIFSLLYIDPFAGLDPAAREIEMARHTAERAMYQFQRMPRMLDWQLSLVLSKSVTMPEIQNLIASADRFSTAAEDLPKQIAEERVALVKDIAANEPKLQDLLTEFRTSFDAAGDAADSVNEAVLTINDFVARFDKSSMQDTTNSTAAKPFDVLEYGIAATKIAGAAREINTLISSADQKMLSQSEDAIILAKSAGTELVDHMFKMTVMFVLIVITSVVVAMLFYRAVTMRFFKMK
ncbi:MAG: hypothetical protein PF692_08690 [Kiritimatiellae bacterium]|jgi:hypothetical protein|nr:hypothetical protein [Kiritimatiellia bacterium]